VLIVLAGMCTGSSEQPSSTAPTTTQPAQPAAPAARAQPQPARAGIGQPVRDGKVEFTVTSFECGRTSVGATQFNQYQANGHLCLLTINAANVGNEAVHFSEGDQHIYDTAGREFSYSLDATFAHGYDPNTYQPFTGLNPGQSQEFTVVYDVPTGAGINMARLHDSPFSNGVEVALQ
jgi:hypothetical protein